MESEEEGFWWISQAQTKTVKISLFSGVLGHILCNLFLMYYSSASLWSFFVNCLEPLDKKGGAILLMEEILHHVGCHTNLVNTGISTTNVNWFSRPISEPSTVCRSTHLVAQVYYVGVATGVDYGDCGDCWNSLKNSRQDVKKTNWDSIRKPQFFEICPHFF